MGHQFFTELHSTHTTCSSWPSSLSSPVSLLPTTLPHLTTQLPPHTRSPPTPMSPLNTNTPMPSRTTTPMPTSKPPNPVMVTTPKALTESTFPMAVSKSSPTPPTATVSLLT